MTFVELRSFTNYIEANIVLNRLRSENINCHLQDENTVTIDPLLAIAIGGIKLMVHHSQLQRAWELLEAAENDYLKEIPCPICHSYSLESVTVTKRHQSKLAALASMLLNGQSVEVQKFYRCMKCKYDFKDLPSH